MWLDLAHRVTPVGTPSDIDKQQGPICQAQIDL